MAGSQLPELDVERVRRWCRQRAPEHLRGRVRVECDAGPGYLTIVECRPPWRNDMGPDWTRFPIARLRYTKAAKRWSLCTGATATCVSTGTTSSRRRHTSTTS